MLPESAGYPEQQTGAEFLRYHARLFGQSRASARATAAGCWRRWAWPSAPTRRSRTYSRGMRQRLGIARALVNDPQSCSSTSRRSGSTRRASEQVLRVVRGIARERGATVVLSTHFLGEVEEVCSRVLILNRGRVVADGTVAEVTRRAAAPRRGRFRVPAELRDGARRWRWRRCPELGDARAGRRAPDWVAVSCRSTPPDVRRRTGGGGRSPTPASRCSRSSWRARGSATPSWR